MVAPDDSREPFDMILDAVPELSFGEFQQSVYLVPSQATKA